MFNKTPLKDLTYGEYIKNYISPNYPKFNVRWKQDSFIMKLWSWIAYFWSQEKRNLYMKKYVTTIGNTVYIPDSWKTRKDHFNMINTLVHEVEHIKQKDRMGIVRHSLAYIFWPLPLFWADYRLTAEAEAIASAIVYSSRVYGTELMNSENITRHAKTLMGPMYFWSTLNQKKAEKIIRKQIVLKAMR